MGGRFLLSKRGIQPLTPTLAKVFKEISSCSAQILAQANSGKEHGGVIWRRFGFSARLLQ